MNRIRFFRRQANITQEQLGKAVGVSQVKIHRWETGKRKIPRETRSKIISILGLPKELIFPDSDLSFSEVLDNEKTNLKG